MEGLHHRRIHEEIKLHALPALLTRGDKSPRLPAVWYPYHRETNVH